MVGDELLELFREKLLLWCGITNPAEVAGTIHTSARSRDSRAAAFCPIGLIFGLLDSVYSNKDFKPKKKKIEAFCGFYEGGELTY